jgi:chromate reductase
MSKEYKVAILIGSLREGSFSKKAARALMAIAPTNLSFEVIDIGRLPLYNPDLDTDTPPHAWAELRGWLRVCDALLFVTPEYNRSVPGCLKNAIDVGSRPPGKSVWQRKPAAIMTTSPGALGGFGANHHLRQMLVFLDVPAMQQPEAYIGGIAKLFDEDGNIVVEASQEFFAKFMVAFAEWISKNAS